VGIAAQCCFIFRRESQLIFKQDRQRHRLKRYSKTDVFRPLKFISECFEAERDVSGAFRHLQKAVELAPNNPKYLDFLLEVSIMLEEKETALETYEKFHAINPENQKLSEYKARIEALIVKKAREG
jgi:tetratricopeptide (TPR) repeat protein